jgi:hypothetical protein
VNKKSGSLFIAGEINPYTLIGFIIEVNYGMA